MAIRLATTSSPAEMAWAAYNAAVLRLNGLYVNIATGTGEQVDQKALFALSVKVVHLWAAFRDAIIDDDGGPGAAA